MGPKFIKKYYVIPRLPGYIELYLVGVEPSRLRKIINRFIFLHRIQVWICLLYWNANFPAHPYNWFWC